MSITLKAARVNANLSLKEVSENLHISVDTLRSWESAKTFPNVPQISKLEKLYGVDYSNINFLLK